MSETSKIITHGYQLFNKKSISFEILFPSLWNIAYTYDITVIPCSIEGTNDFTSKYLNIQVICNKLS